MEQERFKRDREVYPKRVPEVESINNDEENENKRLKSEAQLLIQLHQQRENEKQKKNEDERKEKERKEEEERKETERKEKERKEEERRKETERKEKEREEKEGQDKEKDTKEEENLEQFKTDEEKRVILEQENQKSIQIVREAEDNARKNYNSSDQGDLLLKDRFDKEASIKFDALVDKHRQQRQDHEETVECKVRELRYNENVRLKGLRRDQKIELDAAKTSLQKEKESNQSYYDECVMTNRKTFDERICEVRDKEDARITQIKMNLYPNLNVQNTADDSQHTPVLRRSEVLEENSQYQWYHSPMTETQNDLEKGDEGVDGNQIQVSGIENNDMDISNQTLNTLGDEREIESETQWSGNETNGMNAMDILNQTINKLADDDVDESEIEVQGQGKMDAMDILNKTNQLLGGDDDDDDDDEEEFKELVNQNSQEDSQLKTLDFGTGMNCNYANSQPVDLNESIDLCNFNYMNIADAQMSQDVHENSDEDGEQVGQVEEDRYLKHEEAQEEEQESYDEQDEEKLRDSDDLISDESEEEDIPVPTRRSGRSKPRVNYNEQEKLDVRGVTRYKGRRRTPSPSQRPWEQTRQSVKAKGRKYHDDTDESDSSCNKSSPGPGSSKNKEYMKSENSKESDDEVEEEEEDENNDEAVEEEEIEEEDDDDEEDEDFDSDEHDSDDVEFREDESDEYSEEKGIKRRGKGEKEGGDQEDEGEVSDDEGGEKVKGKKEKTNESKLKPKDEEDDEEEEELPIIGKPRTYKGHADVPMRNSTKKRYRIQCNENGGDKNCTFVAAHAGRMSLHMTEVHGAAPRGICHCSSCGMYLDPYHVPKHLKSEEHVYHKKSEQEMNTFQKLHPTRQTTTTTPTKSLKIPQEYDEILEPAQTIPELNGTFAAPPKRGKSKSRYHEIDHQRLGKSHQKIRLGEYEVESRGRFTLDSSDVVYSIKDHTDPESRYVGSSKNSARTRWMGHESTVKKLIKKRREDELKLGRFMTPNEYDAWTKEQMKKFKIAKRNKEATTGPLMRVHFHFAQPGKTEQDMEFNVICGLKQDLPPGSKLTKEQVKSRSLKRVEIENFFIKGTKATDNETGGLNRKDF